MSQGLGSGLSSSFPKGPGECVDLPHGVNLGQRALRASLFLSSVNWQEAQCFSAASPEIFHMTERLAVPPHGPLTFIPFASFFGLFLSSNLYLTPPNTISSVSTSLAPHYPCPHKQIRARSPFSVLLQKFALLKLSGLLIDPSPITLLY